MHLTLTEFRNESRIIKQTSSLEKARIFSKIYIVALGAEDLEDCKKLSDVIELHRLKLITRKLPRNILFQLIKYFEFLLRALFFIHKKKVCALNVHTIALLPLGWFSKLINKHLLIYDTHELETETHGREGFRKRISKLIERKLIKSCDLIFVVGENIADWYAKEYNIKRPTVVMNAPVAQDLIENDVFRERFFIRPDQAVFLYQGGLAAGRGVPFILEAFKARQDDNAVIVFMGYGELEADIKAAGQHSNCIYFMPAVPPDEVLRHTVAADVGIHMIQNTCLNHFYCMPNKLFEYSMAGLAVIVSDMKEMADFVNRHQSGFVLQDTSPESLNALIDQVLTQDLQKIKANARQAALDNSWEVQEKKMLSAYQQLLA